MTDHQYIPDYLDDMTPVCGVCGAQHVLAEVVAYIDGLQPPSTPG